MFRLTTPWAKLAVSAGKKHQLMLREHMLRLVEQGIRLVELIDSSAGAVYREYL